jgi:hypothetical protein
MKIIQPVSIWYNGQVYEGTIFNMVSTDDNLTTQAVFKYQILDANMLQLANNSLTMDGLDYATYCSSADSNSYAYEWAATKLGLEIVGDYVPPITEVPNLSE